jgi:hypothetical protein
MDVLTEFLRESQGPVVTSSGQEMQYSSERDQALRLDTKYKLGLFDKMANKTAGCGNPPQVSVTSTELTFKNQEPGVLTYRAQVRRGDSVCWQHGENGTVTSSVSEHDRDVTLTISTSTGQLTIECGDGMRESIPVERVALTQNPTLANGKYHVADYVRTLGVARSPEVPLYVFVNKKD